MLVVLGPVDSGEVLGWVKFARRIICEIRLNPDDLQGVVTEDMLVAWSRLIDQWDQQARKNPIFRWSETIESDQAEYLLHGFERCLQSRSIRQSATPEERNTQKRFSIQIVQAFVDGLSEQGRSCQHYVDQVRISVGALLDQ